MHMHIAHIGAPHMPSVTRVTGYARKTTTLTPLAVKLLISQTIQ